MLTSFWTGFYPFCVHVFGMPVIYAPSSGELMAGRPRSKSGNLMGMGRSFSGSSIGSFGHGGHGGGGGASGGGRARSVSSGSPPVCCFPFLCPRTLLLEGDVARNGICTQFEGGMWVWFTTAAQLLSVGRLPDDSPGYDVTL